MTARHAGDDDPPTPAPPGRVDPLSVEQRRREAALYAAVRMTMGGDPSASAIIDYATFILTGDRPPDPPVVSVTPPPEASVLE
jgi:hypothetical protein